MPLFFSHARGSVKRVEGPWQGAPNLRIRVQGMQDNITRDHAIITQVGVTQNGNFQFVHTLNDQIFVYVFGDRISEVRISGIAFGHPCDGQDSNGLEDILQGYEEKKLSATGRPVTVLVGSKRFQSFLTGVSLEVVDPELQLGQFTYRFHSFPQD